MVPLGKRKHPNPTHTNARITGYHNVSVIPYPYNQTSMHVKQNIPIKISLMHLMTKKLKSK